MNIGNELGTNWALIGLLALAALVFGVLYNWFVSWLEQDERSAPYTSLLVVLGVAVTVLLTLPLIGAEAVLVLVVFFILTGLPMIVGHSWRFIQHDQAQKTKTQAAITELLAEANVADELRDMLQQLGRQLEGSDKQSQSVAE